MANAMYNSGRQGFLEGLIHWLTDDIKAVLVDTAQYTFSQSHANLSDIPAGARIATSANLGSKTSTNGTADAADVTFATVSGVSVEAVVLYKDTTVAGTSTLIAYIDTATGLPVTPNGGDINVVWDNGANKIFTL